MLSNLRIPERVAAPSAGDQKKELEALIAKARINSMWLYLAHQNAWFTPEELQKRVDEKGVEHPRENWQLRDPRKRLEDLKTRKEQADKEYTEFCERFKN